MLNLKSEESNLIFSEPEAELPTNLVDKKLSHMEKTNLLRYICCNIICTNILICANFYYYFYFREKHLELKNKFERLDRLTAKGPNHRDFIEPKVQGLWKIALEAKFSPEELASLKV